jgi:hypothetical protein
MYPALATLRFLTGWYVGDSAEDLDQFLRQHGADGHPVHEVRHSACEACRGAVFGIEGSVEDSTVVRLARRYRIGSAAEVWALSRPDLHVHDYELHLKIRPTRAAIAPPPDRPAH